MRAAVYSEFAKPLMIENVPDPTPAEGSVVIGVKATGLCRSDWHGWMGHDPDISLPHVPGHELAGVIEAVGKEVVHWNIGDRVTLPFVCAKEQECIGQIFQLVAANGFMLTTKAGFKYFSVLPSTDRYLLSRVRTLSLSS